MYPQTGSAVKSMRKTPKQPSGAQQRFFAGNSDFNGLGTEIVGNSKYLVCRNIIWDLLFLDMSESRKATDKTATDSVSHCASIQTTS